MNHIKIITAQGSGELQRDINEFFDYLESKSYDLEIIQFTEVPSSYTAFIIYTDND